jgi:hypothetical protein
LLWTADYSLLLQLLGVDHGCRDDVCSRGDDWNGTLMTYIRKDGSRFPAVVPVSRCATIKVQCRFAPTTPFTVFSEWSSFKRQLVSI